MQFFAWHIPGSSTPNGAIAKQAFQTHKLAGTALQVMIPLHFSAAFFHAFLGHKIFAFVARRPWLYAVGGAAFRASFGLAKALRPPLLRQWLATRDLPAAPARSFRDAWRRRA